MPDAIPINNNIFDILPTGVPLVVGGPPNDDAGCAGASFHSFYFIIN